MEENFIILKGKVEFVVDRVTHIGEKGDFYSMQPKESHYLRNAGDEEAVVAFFTPSFVDGDKVKATL
jgi:quercetin dioxygenase-like cupin family protein